MLHNAGEEVLGGLLRAEQDEVDVLVPTKKQAFGQDSDPHHSLQGSRQEQKNKYTWFPDSHVENHSNFTAFSQTDKSISNTTPVFSRFLLLFVLFFRLVLICNDVRDQFEGPFCD